MDWITIDTLKTVGGASLAVTLVTAGIKAVFPKVYGRYSQLGAGYPLAWPRRTSNAFTVFGFPPLRVHRLDVR